MTPPAPTIISRRLAGVAAWQWAALVVGIALLVVALASSSGSKEKVVATVAGQKITLAQYHHWLSIAAVTTHAAQSSLPSFPPDAPNYTRCTSFLRGQATKSGGKAPSNATLLGQCKQLETSVAEDVMQMLISAEWVLDQAVHEGLTVPASTVASSLASSLKQSYPNGDGAAQVEKATGETGADLSYQQQVSLTAQRLEQKHLPTSVTPAQISQYYAAHQSSYPGKTLAQASQSIQQTLTTAADTQATNAYLAALQKQWRPQTSCAPGFAISYYCQSVS